MSSGNSFRFIGQARVSDTLRVFIMSDLSSRQTGECVPTERARFALAATLGLDLEIKMFVFYPSGLRSEVW